MELKNNWHVSEEINNKWVSYSSWRSHIGKLNFCNWVEDSFKKQFNLIKTKLLCFIEATAVDFLNQYSDYPIVLRKLGESRSRPNPVMKLKLLGIEPLRLPMCDDVISITLRQVYFKEISYSACNIWWNMEVMSLQSLQERY